MKVCGPGDLLPGANAVWGASDAHTGIDDLQAAWGAPFWEQAPAEWRTMMTAGPYAYLLASCQAVRLMKDTGSKGLITGVTDFHVEGAAADSYGGQLMWDLSHRCINRMMLGMAHECRRLKIAVVTLMPGFMRTERVERYLSTEKLRKQFGYDRSESVLYLGRAVAALAGDAKVMAKSGQVHFVADLAREYGFTDEDGRQVPRFDAHAK